MNTCINCKKQIEILWPDQWAYRRPEGFLCSWKCLRAWDDRKERKNDMLTDKEKENACRMAARGERPLQYLTQCGAKNPTVGWDACRNWAKKNWPEEAYAKLPERFGQEKKAPEKKEPAKKQAELKRPEEQEWFPAEEVYKDVPEAAEELALKPGGNYKLTVEEKKANIREIRPEPLEAASLWSRLVESGTYKKVQGIGMMLQGPAFQLMLKREEWIRLTGEILMALEQLNIKEEE